MLLRFTVSLSGPVERALERAGVVTHEDLRAWLADQVQETFDIDELRAEIGEVSAGGPFAVHLTTTRR